MSNKKPKVKDPIKVMAGSLGGKKTLALLGTQHFINAAKKRHRKEKRARNKIIKVVK